MASVPTRPAPFASPGPPTSRSPSSSPARRHPPSLPHSPPDPLSPTDRLRRPRLGDRLMVGQQALTLRIEVRALVSQPFFPSHTHHTPPHTVVPSIPHGHTRVHPSPFFHRTGHFDPVR